MDQELTTANDRPDDFVKGAGRFLLQIANSPQNKKWRGESV